MRMWSRPVAAAVAVLAACVGTAWCAVPLLQQDVRALADGTVDTVDPAAVVLVGVETLLVLTVARAGLAAALALAAVAARGAPTGAAGRLAVRLSPRVVRPLVSALLAVGLAAAAVPASAATRGPALPTAGWSTQQAPTPPSTSPTSSRTDAALPAAGWVPTGAPPAPPRAAPPVGLVAAAPHRPAERPGETVTVHRGDCLWSVVARQLGPHASDARVAAEWPRWWAANRAAIGEDPDLLLPGAVLRAPSAAVTR